MNNTRRPTTFPLLSTYACGVVILTVLRIAFLIYHYPLFSQTSTLSLLRAFANGLVIDSSVVATTLIAIRLLTLLVQVINRSIALRLHRTLIYICFGLIFFTVTADIAYFDMFDSRLNILVIENLHQMLPIVKTIIVGGAFYVVTAGWLALMAIFVWLGRRIDRVDWRIFRRYPAAALVISMVVLTALTFLWTGEPFWRSYAFARGDQALGQLSLNGVYTLIKAYDQKKTIERDRAGIDYEFGSEDQAIQLTRDMIISGNEEFLPGQYPLSRRIVNPKPLAYPKPNIVIILMEGFTASNVGILREDSTGFSPAFDSLCQEGILFSNFYGNETRTHHGLVSSVGSFPSVLGMFLTRRRGTESFYTLGSLLKKYGYTTSFIYGYDAGFDHMGFFLRQGGIDRIIDRDQFPSPRFSSQWGVSDEDLYEKALQLFSDTDEPFLSVLLTSSNHSPFKVPDHFLEKFPECADMDINAAFVYADFALEQFIDEARKRPFFRNTIFVIVADHGEIRDPVDRQFKRFHVPCLFFAPDLIADPRVVPNVASQVDIAPTLLHLIGYPYAFHCMGRNLLDMSPDDGFAVMRNDHTLYFREGDAVLVRDIRDTLSAVYPVDDYSRMMHEQTIENDSLKHSLNEKLEAYLQAAYLLFTGGKHRIAETDGT